ncbi:MAG: AAA family ATPase, partial [Kiritimatiellae bacterium]|nr:AAA family ATPase [Kiritimatiellia bacterium]
GALFADDCPIPQSRLFCTVWNGLTKSKDSGNDKEFSGNLIELLDTAEHFIKVNTVRKWKKRSHDRVDYPDYPERAVTEALVNAFVHRDYTMYGSEVHVDIYPDRLEIVSPGGMPDGSLVQELDLRNVASDRRNPILADLFAQMDYMERKGSGFGLILDAYEKEAPNPRGLKPEFFSSSGSFRVVLPNLNHDAGEVSVENAGKEREESRGTISETMNETVNETANETVKAVEEVIVANPGVKIMAIAEKICKSRATVTRALATLKERGRIVYRGSDKTGGYFAKVT